MGESSSDVTIRLANESETYEPGQAIIGRVVIKTDIEEEIKGKHKSKQMRSNFKYNLLIRCHDQLGRKSNSTPIH